MSDNPHTCQCEQYEALVRAAEVIGWAPELAGRRVSVTRKQAMAIAVALAAIKEK